MAVYLLTYDLHHKPEKDYEPVWEYIHSHSYAKLSESSYAIESNATVEQIWQKINAIIHVNDYFLILAISRPWMGRNDKGVIEWLQSALK